MRALFVVALALFLALPAATALAPSRSTMKFVSGPDFMPPDPWVYQDPPFRRAPNAERTPILPYTSTIDVMPAKSSEKLLVLLIDFQDVHASTPSSTINNMLFSTAPGTKSLRDYYRQNSYGKTTVTGQVTTVWLRSAYNMAEYGADSSTGIDDANGPIYRLVTEAVQLADPSIDFRQFDTDGDGVVDHLMVIHAGGGQENDPTGNTNLIWSHRWAVLDADPSRLGDQPLMTADGVRVYSYFMASETSPLGVFAHEFGHDFGLPDLYDIDGSSKGAGIWDIMSSGSWLGSPRGSNPSDFSAWSKVRLGWVTPTIATIPLIQTRVPEVEAFDIIFKLPIRSNPSGDEYFLVENRQQVAYDANIPGSGILIWHVDDSVPNNEDDSHRLVDLVEADNCDCPDRATNVWADNPTGFGPTSTPNSNGYGGVPTNWMVKRISPSASNMTADISQEVGLDVAVAEVQRARFVHVGSPETVTAVLVNRGALNATGFQVNLTLYRGAYDPSAVVNRSITQVTFLGTGRTLNLSWTYTPTQVGKYVAEVSVVLLNDEVPVDDFMIVHFTAITWIFRDTVESGTNGWTSNAGALSEYQWLQVAIGQPYGDAYSPTHSWRFGFFQNLSNPLPQNYYTLTSPSIALGGQRPYLSFFQRYLLAGKIFNASSTILMQPLVTDSAAVEVSSDGGPWVQVASFLGNQVTWDHHYVDLTNFVPAGASSLQVRFNTTPKVMPNDGGWWLDDITVLNMPLLPGVAVRAVDSFETVPPGGRAIYRFSLVNLGDVTDNASFAAGLPSGWHAALGFNESGFAEVRDFTAFLPADGSAILLLAVDAPLLAQRGSRVTGTLGASMGGGRANSNFSFVAEVSSGFNLNLDQRTILILVVSLGVLAVVAIGITEVRKRRRRYPYGTIRAVPPPYVRPPPP